MVNELWWKIDYGRYDKMTAEQGKEVSICHIRKQTVLDGRDRQVYVRILPASCESAPSGRVKQSENQDNKERNTADFSWVWDEGSKSHDVVLCNCSREVYFHPDYSCGTAAVRGSHVLQDDEEHYWEIQMTSAVYGTDMMIGVGTLSLNLNRFKSQFCSLIGRDCESWGLSYFGTFHSNGSSRHFAKKFERDTVIGVHLDMWKGTLSFYKDGEPLGVAASNLRGKQLFPVVSSTAARTRMKLLCSHSTHFSLQLLCCKVIFKCLVNRLDLIQHLPLPQRVKEYLLQQIKWIFKLEGNRHSQGPVPKRLKR